MSALLLFKTNMKCMTSSESFCKPPQTGLARHIGNVDRSYTANVPREHIAYGQRRSWVTLKGHSMGAVGALGRERNYLRILDSSWKPTRVRWTGSRLLPLGTCKESSLTVGWMMRHVNRDKTNRELGGPPETLPWARISFRNIQGLPLRNNPYHGPGHSMENCESHTPSNPPRPYVGKMIYRDP